MRIELHLGVHKTASTHLQRYWLTTYAIRASALATDALVRKCLIGRRGTIESGELAVIEEAGGRLLSTSLYTRWTSDDAAP